MADDTQTIEQLRKALEKAAATAALRQPWQEHFSRETSAPADATVLATDIIRGFSGSWASSYNYGLGATTSPENVDIYQNQGEIPIPIREKQTKLGQPGFSDIDFVPYNYRTNRFSNKGGSFVGHPISYEVVGPTLKSAACDWTWAVEQGAGPNGGDTLTFEGQPDSLGGGLPVTFSFSSAYGISDFTIGGSGEPLGGLYVLISSDGPNPGSIRTGETPMGALPEHVDSARFELFRISNITTDEGVSTIELHPNKPLSNYFDLPLGGNRMVRAITVIQPYVTRLMPVPGSGPSVGREQTYLIISPERAAQSDIYPPIDGGTLGDGTWEQGGFDPAGTGIVGNTAAYGGRSVLPVPAPIRQGFGQIEKSPAVPSTELGTFILEDVNNGSPSDVGRVLHIYHLNTDDDDPLFNTEDLGSAIGWFEVVAVDPLGETYTLQRVAEVDPTTGQPFYGPVYHQAAGDPFINVYFTVHEPVSTLFEGAFDIDAVQASRLDCLIDPRVVEPTDKQVSNTSAAPEPAGRSPARADRAIFNTRTFSTGGSILDADNPGSLLDLGFRMVLFPAQDDDADGQGAPDFNRPILGRELVIDPSIDEPQFLTIDYSAGTVKLSHPPPETAGGDIIPGGLFSGPNNPRGEVMLYAACVPYSREDCQKGTGIRVTGGPRTGVEAGNVDIFSARITAAVDLVNSPALLGVPPFFDQECALDREIDIPETGFFDVVADGLGTESIGTWGYHGTRVDNFGGGDVTVLEGVYASAFPVVQDPSGFANPTVVIRKDLFFGQDSDDNSQDIDDVRFDTTYGSSVRTCVMRFPGANCTMQIDGSVVMTIDNAGIEIQDEGALVAANATVMNFQGAGVTATLGTAANEVDVTFTGVIGVEDEGALVSAAAQILNFAGAGVSVTDVGGGQMDVSIPGATGQFTLVDTQTVAAAAGASTITFSGLDSENDGVYMFIGKAIASSGMEIELLPDGVDPGADADSEFWTPNIGGGSLFEPASGLCMGANPFLPEGTATSDITIFFVYFLWPRTAQGGASGTQADRRQGVGIFTVGQDSSGVDVYTINMIGSTWDETSPSSFTSFDIVEGAVGANFERGTQISLWRMTQ